MLIGVTGCGGDRFADIRLDQSVAAASPNHIRFANPLPLVSDSPDPIQVGQIIGGRKCLVFSDCTGNGHTARWRVIEGPVSTRYWGVFNRQDRFSIRYGYVEIAGRLASVVIVDSHLHRVGSVIRIGVTATEGTLCRDQSTSRLCDVHFTTVDGRPIAPIDIERECLSGRSVTQPERVKTRIGERRDRRDLEQRPFVQGYVLCQSRHCQRWNGVVDRDRTRASGLMRTIFVHDSSSNSACTVVGEDMAHRAGSGVRI